MLYRINQAISQNNTLRRHEKLVHRILLLTTILFTFISGLLVGAYVIIRLSTKDGGCLADPKSEVFSFCVALSTIQNNYVIQPVNDKTLVEAAIQGMTTSLNDKHSTYLSADEYHEFEASLSGEYTGVGFYGKNVGGRLMVVTVFKGSPAEESGLAVGDVIYSVDGSTWRDMDYEAMSRKISGPAGSTVTIEIVRNGETVPLSITREKIEAPTVSYKDLPGNIAYANVTVFGENTYGELAAALASARLENKSGLVVDLRDNGGGRLTSLKDVASLFLPEGTTYMIRIGSDGKEDVLQTEKDGLYQNIPIAVLVNENTASAAEAFTATIMASDRGTTVGTKTYGKGTVQSVVELPNGSGLRITISRWVTPDRTTIQGNGISPDFVVEPSQDLGIDNQLDLAFKILK